MPKPSALFPAVPHERDKAQSRTVPTALKPPPRSRRMFTARSLEPAPVGFWAVLDKLGRVVHVQRGPIPPSSWPGHRYEEIQSPDTPPRADPNLLTVVNGQLVAMDAAEVEAVELAALPSAKADRLASAQVLLEERQRLIRMVNVPGAPRDQLLQEVQDAHAATAQAISAAQTLAELQAVPIEP